MKRALLFAFVASLPVVAFACAPRASSDAPPPLPASPMASAAATATASAAPRPTEGVVRPYTPDLSCFGDAGAFGPWEVHAAAVKDLDVPFVSRIATARRRPIGSTGITWAHYLNAWHNAIHPIFADQFLASICTRPPTDPINDGTLTARLEIAVGRDGELQRVGVVKSSGVRELDLAALESVEHVRSVGPVDAAILSDDGVVYMTWEFHRDAIFACSTMHAQPYLLVTTDAGGL